MGWFDFLTGSSKAIETGAKVVETGASMLDNAFYTDQERAEVGVKQTENYLKHQELTLQQSTPTAITRRYLMWGIFGLVFELVQVALILALFGKDWQVVVQIGAAFQIGWAFVAGVVFYFGNHIAAAVKAK